MTLPTKLIWSGSLDEFQIYLDKVYELFLSSFVQAKLQFLRKPVKARWHSPYQNKHFSFWHVISEDTLTGREEDRTPNLRRCEQIGWLGYTIENANDRDKVWCWRNQRTGRRGPRTHCLLYLHQERYLVVLAEEEDYFLLVTAYPIERDHSHIKLIKEKENSEDPRDSST